ncbi:hypothetical protein LCGC14_0562910, partial [marine sediment metagenome]
MGQHKDITVAKGIHIVHAFEFADATARNAASVVTADIGKVARQLDDDSFYVLQNTTPTWAQISGVTGAPVGASYVVISLDATLTAERRLQAEASVLSLTDSGANGDITVGVLANGISNAKLRDSAGTSVIGKATAGSGDPADIVAGVDDRVLSRAGGALAFTLIATAMIAANAIDDTKLRDSAATSVIGRSAGSFGDPADIAAGADNTVLQRIGGSLSFAVLDTIPEDLSLTGDITPASLAANTNNYTPPGAYATSSTVRQASSVNVNITGLTGGVDGRVILFHNIGSNDITLTNQDGASTAANRFALSANLTLQGDESAFLQYDSTSLRWRLAAHSATSSEAAPRGASYVVIALDATLTAERRLQAEASVLTLTDGGANGDITVGVAVNGISNAKLRDSVATSVIGRAGGTTGDPADIAAAVDDRVLARAAGTLSFTQISTAMVADDAITFAKMQDIATDRLLGRDTAATGNVEELTVTGGVEFTGAGGIRRSALTGDVTAAAGSNATTIAANAVSDTKLRDSAARSVLGRSAATGGDPADIVAGADDTVLARAGGTLAFQAISTAMIANDAVTFAKIQNITTDRLLGRDTAASGDTEEITVAGGLEFTGATGIQRSALTGDVTAPAGSNATTIAADAVDDTKLRDSVATSVIGRSAGSTGDPADIVAGADFEVLQRTGGTLSFSVIDTIPEDFALTGDITPSSLAANQNNYTPSGAYTTASTVRQAASAAVDITGLTGGADGRLVLFHNIGTFDITLKDQDGASTAANRFALNADIVLGADHAAVLQYDSTSSRWRAAGSTVGGTGGGIGGTIATGGLIAFSTALDVIGGNTKFKWDDVNERLGVGKAVPAFTIDAVDKASSTIQLFWGKNGINSQLQVTGSTAQKQRIFLSNGSASGGFEMQTVAGGNDLHWLIDGANDLILKTNSVIRGRMTSGGNHFLSGEGGLAASATDGFPYVTSVAGIPTGTPTSETNMSPFVLNRTDNIWYFYDGANWVPIGNPALVDLQLMAEQTGVPSNAAYPVTVVAPIITDANDGDLKVAAYDDTTEEGRSFDLFIPPGATRIEFQW